MTNYNIFGIFNIPIALCILSGCIEKSKDITTEINHILIKDVTMTSAIDFTHKQSKYFDKYFPNISRYMSSTSSAVAVADVNNDGWQDIFLTNDTGKHALYINLKNGKFKNQFSISGITTGDVDNVLRPIFFDFDNDGLKDLFLGTNKRYYLYKNMNGIFFKDVTARLGLAQENLLIIAANVIDYNKDGYLDLVVSGYFKEVDRTKNSRFMPTTFNGAENGGPVYFYKNEGGKKFVKQKDALGIPGGGWTLAIGVYDLNYDGYDDLWFATDFNTDRVYENVKGKSFKDISKSLEHSFSNNGMSAEIAEIDDDGQPVIFVSQIYQEGIETDGNTLFKRNKQGRYIDQAKKRGVDKCGWAWGAKFIDLDNNSKLDIIVNNGYFSGDPQKNLWFKISTLGSAGKGFLEDAKNWPDLNDVTWGGHQTKCIFYNTGKKFIDISKNSPLGKNRGDGRSVAAIDFRNNGYQSILMTMQNGKTSLYEVSNKRKANWIGFTAIGKKSGTDAFGTKIRIQLKDRVLVRAKHPTNGFLTQSDERIHFGLGRNEKIQKVSITWPSGKIVELKKYQLNRYNMLYE